MAANIQGAKMCNSKKTQPNDECCDTCLFFYHLGQWCEHGDAYEVNPNDWCEHYIKTYMPEEG